MENKIEVIFLPLPGMGHLISAVELAKRVNETRKFSVTILLMNINLTDDNYNSSISSYITSVTTSNSATNIRFVHLPHVELPRDENQSIEAAASLSVVACKPHVKEAITCIKNSSPSTHVAALIVDLFSTAMVDVGKELGVPTYVFFPSGAALLGLMLYLPTLDSKVEGDFKDYQGEFDVPSMSAFPPTVMPSPMMRRNDAYTSFVYHGRRFREMSGLIVNTFAELEPKPLAAIVNGDCLPDNERTPPVYTVGPLVALDERPNQSDCTQLTKWLDQQPPSSVLFLCFGSMGTFSPQQVHEIAHALERSGHRFLWCLRHRSTERFGLPVDPDLNRALPGGFLDRTRDRGLVWPSWAPQVSVLGHVAVGGFVSHCGWNSILESIWFGVPMLAWPLYAEQRLNAFQMVRDYGIAVGLQLDYERDGGGWVSAEEIERGVRRLMGESDDEGQRVRKRAKEMSEAGRKAVKQGGSSFSALESLAQQFVKSASDDGC